MSRVRETVQQNAGKQIKQGIPATKMRGTEKRKKMKK